MINNSAWKLEAGGRTQNRGQGPIPGGMNPKPGGRNLKTGTWSTLHEIFFPNSLSLIFWFHDFVSCTVVSSSSLSLEYDIGSYPWPPNFLVGSAQIHVVDMLQWACVWSVVVPLIPMTWKWIIRKNHHDKTLPPWWGLVRVGRKFDGEAGNVCIDASAHTPDASAAPVAILSLSSGMTSDPKILRGRILVRPRIRRMRRLNKTRRPKLRILMLDSTGLTCPSCACKSCNGLSFRSSYRSRYFLLALSQDCTLTFGRGTFGMFILVLGDNIVDSWYRSRTFRHVVWDFVQKRRDWMDFRPETLRLDGVSSRNPEAGWTFVLESGDWMDYRPGPRRLVELLSRNLMVVWTFKGTFYRLRRALWSGVFLYQNLGACSNASSSYPWEDLKTEPDVLGMHHIPPPVDGL
ncbi:hypothetical protein HID58_055611, partial [Brassica napus]